MAQTLAQLRAESQQRANQESKTLVSTSEWARYINEAIAELYDLILAANPHYYVLSQAFTLTSINTLDLTTVTNFYKFRGLDYLPGGTNRPLTVHPFNFAERNKRGYRGYALEGSTLMIQPQTNFAGNYTVWFTPVAPTLVADGDVLDFILNPWSEFITVTTAIAAGAKAEDDISALLVIKFGQDGQSGIVGRIKASAPTRDGEPAQAADLTTPTYDAWDWGLY